jgi:hypothetical protein
LRDGFQFASFDGAEQSREHFLLPVDPLMQRLFERRQGFDDGLHIPTSTSPGPRDRSGKFSAEAAMPFGVETGIAR